MKKRILAMITMIAVIATAMSICISALSVSGASNVYTRDFSQGTWFNYGDVIETDNYDAFDISGIAAGEQSKLMARASRYAGISEIKNEFFDLLDMAADASAEFDLENNTRDYLLKSFSINEGKNALEKAEINMKIYDKLESYGG